MGTKMVEPKSSHANERITGLLRAWTEGSTSAEERLFSVAYSELKRRAAAYLAEERKDHTLQPAALVHETYLRLRAINKMRWRNRNHFLSMASKTMRRVLVEHARGKNRKKRGAGIVHVALDELRAGSPDRISERLAIEESLRSLEYADPFKAAILELRFRQGLSIADTARSLGCSTATIQRQSRMARAWLVHLLEGRSSGAEG